MIKRKKIAHKSFMRKLKFIIYDRKLMTNEQFRKMKMHSCTCITLAFPEKDKNEFLVTIPVIRKNELLAFYTNIDLHP